MSERESVKCENCLFFLISLVKGVTIVLIFSKEQLCFIDLLCYFTAFNFIDLYSYLYYFLLSDSFVFIFFFVSSFLSRCLDYWFEIFPLFWYMPLVLQISLLALLYLYPQKFEMLCFRFQSVLCIFWIHIIVNEIDQFLQKYKLPQLTQCEIGNLSILRITRKLNMLLKIPQKRNILA